MASYIKIFDPTVSNFLHIAPPVRISNWRMISLQGNRLHLVNEHLCSYFIQNLSIKKFIELSRIESDPESSIFKTGRYLYNNLPCSICDGSGITDWISDIVKNKVINYDMKYIIGSDFYKAKVKLHNTNFTWYFSKALLPEAHKHCENCLGTGLNLPSDVKKDLKPFTFKY